MRLSFGNFTINSVNNEHKSKKPVLTSKNTEIDLEFGDNENQFLETKTLKAVSSRKKSFLGINNNILSRLRASLLNKSHSHHSSKKKHKSRKSKKLELKRKTSPEKRYSVNVRLQHPFGRDDTLDLREENIYHSESFSEQQNVFDSLPKISTQSLTPTLVSPRSPDSLDSPGKASALAQAAHKSPRPTVTSPMPALGKKFELFEVTEQPSECERSEMSKTRDAVLKELEMRNRGRGEPQMAGNLKKRRVSRVEMDFGKKKTETSLSTVFMKANLELLEGEFRKNRERRGGAKAKPAKRPRVRIKSGPRKNKSAGKSKKKKPKRRKFRTMQSNELKKKDIRNKLARTSKNISEAQKVRRD